MSETAAELIIKIAAALDPSMASTVSAALGQTEAFYGKTRAADEAAAESRVALEQRVAQKIFELTNTRVDVQKKALDDELNALRAKGVSEEQLAQLRVAAAKKIEDEIAANAKKAMDQQVASQRQADAERVASAKQAASQQAADEAHLQQMRQAAFDSMKQIGSSAMGLAKGFVNAAAELGGFNRQLEAVTHSSSKASEVMAAAQEMAAHAPFTFESIAHGAVMLTTFGQNAQKWLPLVGNLAARMGADFDESSAIIGRALMGDHMALRSLRHELGISTDMLRKYGATINNNGEIITAGAGNIDKLRAAIEKIATVEAAGAMEKMHNTMKGAVADLKDAIFKFQATVGNILMPAVTESVHMLKTLAEAFNDLGPVTKGFIAWGVAGAAAIGAVGTAAAGARAIFGPLITTLGGAESVFVALNTPITLATFSLAAMEAAADSLMASLTALAVNPMTWVIAGTAAVVYFADKLITASDEAQKLNDKIDAAESAATRWGNAMKEAAKKGLDGIAALRDLVNKGFTKEQAVEDHEKAIAEVGRLTAKKNAPKFTEEDEKELRNAYADHALPTIQRLEEKKTAQDFTAEDQRELERQQKLAETTHAAGAVLPHKDDTTPDPEAQRAAQLQEVEQEMKLLELRHERQELDGKISREAQQQYINELRQLEEKAAALARGNKDDIKLQEEELSIHRKVVAEEKKLHDDAAKAHKHALDERFKDTEAFVDKAAAQHKKDYELQIHLIDQALRHQYWSHDQRLKLLQKREHVAGNWAESEVNAQFKKDENAYSAGEGGTKDFDGKIRALEALKQKYAQYGSIVEKIEAKIAAVQEARTRAEEAAAKKRTDIAARMADEVARIHEDADTANDRAIARQVDAARKAGVSEVQIAEWVAAKKKEAMEAAHEKTKAILEEMNDEVARITKGETAYQIAKIADKVEKLRKAEAHMSDEDKAKTEDTIAGYLKAKETEELKKQAELTGDVATAQEKAAHHAERGAEATERTRDAARELRDHLGGLSSPLQSLSEAMEGMSLGLHFSLSGGSNSMSAAVAKAQTKAGSMTADQIRAQFAQMGSAGASQPPGGFAGPMQQAVAAVKSQTIPSKQQDSPFDAQRDGKRYDWQKAGAGGFDWNRQKLDQAGNPAAPDNTAPTPSFRSVADHPQPHTAQGGSQNFYTTIHLGTEKVSPTPQEASAAKVLAEAASRRATDMNKGKLPVVGGQ